jgi:quercetin 2,3-dioxygenase
MLTVRKSADRGHANFGWLDSHHTFSFGQYHDTNHMGFGPLRVINDDRVAGGGGFATHAHANMEIVTYVLDGALEHRDSLGTGSLIRSGDVQRMSAGSGIRHSEFNASKTEPVHFLQIWIVPDQLNIAPSYEQIAVPHTVGVGDLRLIASRTGRDGSLSVHADVDIYSGKLGPNHSMTHTIKDGRIAWLQVARGSVRLNDLFIEAGDGVAIDEDGPLTLQGTAQSCELLLFSMSS